MRGRAMFTQGTVEVRAEGIIFAIGNSFFVASDAGVAIQRRIRPFLMNKLSTSKTPLL